MSILIKYLKGPDGYCPIQATGFFLGYFFYFRSRWSIAEIDFSKTEESWWRDDIKIHFELTQTKEYQAGWLSHRKCKWLIYKGCFKFAIFLLKNKYKKLWENKQQ